MTAFSRLALAALALTLVMAAPAAAQSVKFEVLAPQPTYVFFTGSAGGGEIILCVGNQAFGGIWHGGMDGDPYSGGACPARTSPQTVSLPPAGGGDLPVPPDGGGLPAPPGGGEPPCAFPTGCLDQIAAAFGCESFDQSCLEQHTGGDGGGGGGGAPAPPDGAPAPRDCASASGGGAVDATCFGTEDMYFLGKQPSGGGPGEIGICAGAAGYFYGSGPTPQGGAAGGPCPTAAAPASAPPSSSGGKAEPDQDNDGVADSGDRCPTVAGSTSDGCPPQSSGGEQTSGGTEQTSGGSQTTTRQPAQSQPPAPAESPRIDIMRRRLGVSRRGKVAIPLKCETQRAICRGTLKLTATRRTKSGRRVRVVLARAEFLVPAGGTLERKVRLTRAGRRLLAANRSVRTKAKFVLASSTGKVTRRDRVTLRRR